MEWARAGWVEESPTHWHTGSVEDNVVCSNMP